MTRKPRQTHKLVGGKLKVFPRPGNQFWWCGFYHGKQHIRATTGTSDLKSAKKFAETWFYRKQLELVGVAPVAPKAKSFETAAQKALASYRSTRAASYVKSLEILINRIVPVIGKEAIDAMNQSTWNRYKQHLLAKKAYKPTTIHQHKNAIHVVLKQALFRGELTSVPNFLDDSKVKVSTPRTWFELPEYERLFKALRANIAAHKKTKWNEAAHELRDYALLVANSGLRVGEAMNVRFCDVEIIKEHDDRSGKPDVVTDCLLIKNIKGKRGTGQAKSFFGAVRPFERCWQRRGLTKETWQVSTERVFKEYHRDMFRELLESAKLRFTNDQPPRTRDLMSLRHTYICFRLLQGVPIYDLAANCRTSVAMIQEHYAKWLSPALSTSINRSAKALYNVTD